MRIDFDPGPPDDPEGSGMGEALETLSRYANRGACILLALGAGALTGAVILHPSEASRTMAEAAFIASCGAFLSGIVSTFAAIYSRQFFNSPSPEE